MSIEVYNNPKRIPREDYELEIQRYSDRVTNVKGLISLMSMGSIGAPGLSDIDLIAVVDDDISIGEAQKFDVDGLRRDLFLHGPILLPKKCIKDLNCILYATNLETILGENIIKEIEVVDHSDSLLSLLYLVDFSESRFRQYAEVKVVGRIDQRSWMTRLWSITHTANLCEAAELSISDNDFEVIHRIRQMRFDWLDGKTIKDTHFVEAFMDSERVLKNVFQNACAMAYTYLGDPILPRSATFIGGNKRIVCRSGVTSPSVRLVRVRGHGAVLSTTRVGLKYASYLSHYGFSRDKADFDIQTPLAKLMRKRSECVSGLSSFHREKKVEFSMGGYLGLPFVQNQLINDLKFKMGWAFGV